MKFKIMSLLATSILAVAATSSFAEITWDEKYYNPKPAEDDVVLPMPCGGAMAFRKIAIPLSGPLDDHPVVIGQDGVGMGFAEHSRPAFLAGSFTPKEQQGSRYYLLAKYELSELQLQVLTVEECPAPSNKLRIPALPENWFAAVSAADKYNRWLLENAKESLPVEDGVPGFARLPTEVEWEFAARGGLAVSTAEFRDVSYPMPKGINSYEWFAGAQSANGKIQLTGLLEPNPLGLHDMLGNVDEMMFEPFRLNKLDREHGQVGGYLVRGANYRSAQSDLRSSARREEPYYQLAGKNSTSGVRFAIGASTFTSRERVQAIEAGWNNLGRGDTAGKGTSAIGELGKLASTVDDAELKKQLKSLEAEIRSKQQQQEEARDQAIRSSLNLGAFLCTKLLDDGKFVDFLQKNYSLSCEDGNTDSTCEARTVKLAEQKDRVYKLGRYYASTLVEASTFYSEPLLAAQVPVFSEIIANNPQLKELKPYLDTHWINQQAFLADGKINVDGWIDSCKKVNLD